MRMTFGRHRGQLVSDVPSGYLAWALDECTNVEPVLRRAIYAEMMKRRREAEQTGEDDEP